MTHAARRVPLALAALALAACSKGPQPSAWEPVDPSTAPAEIAERVRLAEEAIADLGGRLMQTLATELGEGGPTRAIDVCRELAPALAAKVSTERGVRLGRTSHRLRNPSNTAPAWAAEAVSAGVAEPRTWSRSDGAVAVLRPIRLMSLCTTCHGSAEDLGDGVADALREHYPADRATGFAEGDLRGHFWAQVGP